LTSLICVTYTSAFNEYITFERRLGSFLELVDFLLKKLSTSFLLFALEMQVFFFSIEIISAIFLSIIQKL